MASVAVMPSRPKFQSQDDENAVVSSFAVASDTLEQPQRPARLPQPQKAGGQEESSQDDEDVEEQDVTDDSSEEEDSTSELSSPMPVHICEGFMGDGNCPAGGKPAARYTRRIFCQYCKPIFELYGDLAHELGWNNRYTPNRPIPRRYLRVLWVWCGRDNWTGEGEPLRQSRHLNDVEDDEAIIDLIMGAPRNLGVVCEADCCQGTRHGGDGRELSEVEAEIRADEVDNAEAMWPTILLNYGLRRGHMYDYDDEYEERSGLGKRRRLHLL